MAAAEFLRGRAGCARRRIGVGLMPRYRLLIEYDGTPYVGWQRQANGRCRAAGDRGGDRGLLRRGCCASSGAGRTDAGVHATGQVAHRRPRQGLARRRACATPLNAHLTLPDERVAILAAERVADDFDARFSAKGRRYLYRIVDRRPPLGARARPRLALPQALDAEAMHAAAQRLLGHHDFTTFRSADCQAEIADEDARPARRRRGRRGDPCRRRGALLPAQPGALDGRLAASGSATAAGRPRISSRPWRRATGPAAPRWRRRTGSI